MYYDNTSELLQYFTIKHLNSIIQSSNKYFALGTGSTVPTNSLVVYQWWANGTMHTGVCTIPSLWDLKSAMVLTRSNEDVSPSKILWIVLWIAQYVPVLPMPALMIAINTNVRQPKLIRNTRYLLKMLHSYLGTWRDQLQSRQWWNPCSPAGVSPYFSHPKSWLF